MATHKLSSREPFQGANLWGAPQVHLTNAADVTTSATPQDQDIMTWSAAQGQWIYEHGGGHVQSSLASVGAGGSLVKNGAAPSLTVRSIQGVDGVTDVLNGDVMQIGLQVPLANKADLLTFDGFGYAVQPGGANGQVLSMDGTETSGLKWTNAGASVTLEDAGAPSSQSLVFDGSGPTLVTNSLIGENGIALEAGSGAVGIGLASQLVAKGDILTFGSDYSTLAVGANSQVLIADSGAANGMRWDDSPSGGTVVNTYGCFIDLSAPPFLVGTSYDIVTGLTAGSLDGVTFHTSAIVGDYLTVQQAGSYRFDCSASYSLTSGDINLAMGLHINETFQPGYAVIRKVANATDIGSSSFNGILTLAVNDRVGVRFGVSSGVVTLTLDSLQFSLYKVSGDPQQDNKVSKAGDAGAMTPGTTDATRFILQRGGDVMLSTGGDHSDPTDGTTTITLGTGKSQAAHNLATGDGNIQIGSLAGDAFTTANLNVCVGDQTMGDDEAGYGNTALGYRAGFHSAATVDNIYNVFVGESSGPSTSSAFECDRCTCVGRGAQIDNSAALKSNSTVVGYLAQNDLSQSVVLGNVSVNYVMNQGDFVCSLGHPDHNFDHVWCRSAGSTADERFVLKRNNQVALSVGGDHADPTLSNDTVTIGRAVSQAVDTAAVGDLNVLIGARAGVAFTTANQNVVVGADAMGDCSAGFDNTVIGYKAGEFMPDTADNKYNVFIGTDSGPTTNTVGGGYTVEKSVCIGRNAEIDNSTAVRTNCVALGHGATVEEDKTVILGNEFVDHVANQANGACNLGHASHHWATVFQKNMTFMPQGVNNGGEMFHWTNGVAPSGADDTYGLGATWIDQMHNRGWVCTYNGLADYAVWREIGNAGPLHLSDVKASGVDGGTFTQGAWRVRDLNTADGNQDMLVSVSGNAFILETGYYTIAGPGCPGRECGDHRAQLWSNTRSVEVVGGTSEIVGTSGNLQTRSAINGSFQALLGESFSIRHRCSISKSTTGLGNSAPGAWNVTNIYTSVDIFRDT